MFLTKPDYRIHQYTETWKRVTAAPVHSTALALHPVHFSGHLTDNRAPSIMSLFGLWSNKKSLCVLFFIIKRLPLASVTGLQKQTWSRTQEGIKGRTGKHKIIFLSRTLTDEHVMLWAGQLLKDLYKWSVVTYHFTLWTERSQSMSES